MVDVTFTPASVVPRAGASIQRGFCGADTITAGKVVARDASNNVVLADSNSATTKTRQPIGVAVHGASPGQPIAWVESGEIDVGAVLTNQAVYLLSETPGGMQPMADLGAGEYGSVIGIAVSTSRLKVAIITTGTSA